MTEDGMNSAEEFGSDVEYEGDYEEEDTQIEGDDNENQLLATVQQQLEVEEDEIDDLYDASFEDEEPPHHPPSVTQNNSSSAITKYEFAATNTENTSNNSIVLDSHIPEEELSGYSLPIDAVSAADFSIASNANVALNNGLTTPTNIDTTVSCDSAISPSQSNNVSTSQNFILFGSSQVFIPRRSSVSEISRANLTNLSKLIDEPARPRALSCPHRPSSFIAKLPSVSEMPPANIDEDETNADEILLSRQRAPTEQKLPVRRKSAPNGSQRTHIVVQERRRARSTPFISSLSSVKEMIDMRPRARSMGDEDELYAKDDDGGGDDDDDNNDEHLSGEDKKLDDAERGGEGRNLIHSTTNQVIVSAIGESPTSAEFTIPSGIGDDSKTKLAHVDGESKCITHDKEVAGNKDDLDDNYNDAYEIEEPFSKNEPSIDDEYDDEADFDDGESEDQSRRETESLLREAQLLVQTQFGRDVLKYHDVDEVHDTVDNEHPSNIVNSSRQDEQTWRPLETDTTIVNDDGGHQRDADPYDEDVEEFTDDWEIEAEDALGEYSDDHEEQQGNKKLERAKSECSPEAANPADHNDAFPISSGSEHMSASAITSLKESIQVALTQSPGHDLTEKLPSTNDKELDNHQDIQSPTKSTTSVNVDDDENNQSNVELGTPAVNTAEPIMSTSISTPHLREPPAYENQPHQPKPARPVNEKNSSRSSKTFNSPASAQLRHPHEPQTRPKHPSPPATASPAIARINPKKPRNPAQPTDNSPPVASDNIAQKSNSIPRSPSPSKSPQHFTFHNKYSSSPRKEAVPKQKSIKKPNTSESKHRLMPVKIPPHFRMDFPTMDKTKREWLFLNMFRHGDDMSKYEPFITQTTSRKPPSARKEGAIRPRSARQAYSITSDASIGMYGRGGRQLVQQQDPALLQKERNWVVMKPLDSSIPAYDSILDKHCTTVTSPTIQRHIYQTRFTDLSPQLAFVLEKRAAKQCKGAFGAVSSSYMTPIVPVPPAHAKTGS